MSSRPLLVRSPRAGGLRAIIGEQSFGYPSYVTASLPDRVYVGLDSAERPPSVQLAEPAVEVTRLPSPAESLAADEEGARDAWPAETRRSVARLEAMWLLMEDRHRLLDAELVEPLAHQASLVHHILAQPSLKRVLIADEVGLGKTVEAALLIKRLLEASPDRVLRVLYLSPSGLVDNVVEEFVRMGLRPRRWTSTHQEARLLPGDSDPLVVASIHRAVFRGEKVNHFETVMRSGPWDVLIVDEAHHLTDYSPDGSDPKLRMRLVKTLVKERLSHDGRVVLMTGTPHQGHAARFKNLLRVLDEAGGPEGAQGRIIYRTKEDIRDWEGKPLFPVRDVRPPTVVEVGEEYRSWLRDIHGFFSLSIGTRMGLWRRAQALQWAASSPQAGLAYLVRMAIRSGMRVREVGELREAIQALRPYRGGAAQETPEALERRLEQLAQTDEADDEDPETTAGLTSLIATGTLLVRGDAISDKLRHLFRWVDEAPDEKFVVFAQPIETVYTLRDRLEQHLGPGTVVMVVGDQDSATRSAEVRRFREEEQVRVLVSSKAGGEGINLQVSRRLVHFDVPWNPMEMEQRVGRVHRFGSLHTVIVETLVLDGSREQRVLDRCRARLGQIVRDLDPDRFDYLYRRTMSQIPMDDLAILMAGEGFGPLSPDETERIDHYVTAGYESWREADDRFRQQAERIRTLDRGVVREEDLEGFLIGSLGAEVEPGWHQRGFEVLPGQEEPQVVEQPARVLRLPNDVRGYLGLVGGVGPASDVPGRPRPRRLGLNDSYVATQVRQRLGEGTGKASEGIRGAGLVMVPRSGWRDWTEEHGLTGLADGGVLLAFVRRNLDISTPSVRETASELILHVAADDGRGPARLSAEAGAGLVRLVRRPRPKRTRPAQLAGARIVDLERRLATELAATGPGLPAVGVFPFAAIWVEPADE